MKIKTQDLLELSNSLRHSISVHEVKKKLRDSLLEDILFQVANLVDEAQGTNIHESIFAELENYEPPKEDYLVCELLLVTNSKKKIESNVLLSDVEHDGCLKLNLEVLLELRDISEIDEEVQYESKFQKIKFKRVALTSMNQSVKELKTDFFNLTELEVEIRKHAKNWV